MDVTDSTPFVVSIAQGDQAGAFRQALEEAGLWSALEEERNAWELPKEDFRILLKPDLAIFDPGAPTGADPRLVERLIDLLVERGYSNVVVADGLGAADQWLENRDVLILADLLGYRFVTDGGHPYDVLNLSEEVEDAGFPSDSVLAGTGLSRHWQEAHFRINFCKNKTDEEYYYALGLQNLLGILPLRAKDYHYRHRINAGEAAAALLQATRVHFTLIDAWVSNHGSQGSRHAHPIPTGTFIASRQPLLADWVGALKMDLDPYASSINATALRRLGLPVNYRISGDLSPYPGWKNVPLLLQESTACRNQLRVADRLSRAWFQEVNTEVFPFKNVLDQQINSALVPLLQDIDRHPLAYWTLVAANYLIANLFQAQEAWQIMARKDRLYRRPASLGIDLQQFGESDYEAVRDYILPFAQIARQAPPDANGLRWRYIDGSVLFAYSRVIRAPYAAFVERVDIAQSVQLMFDNIGGVRVPVKTDENGRVTHQAERDIYLPQPNWLALFGGKYIDVCKIEVLRYEAQRQQIFWRTVDSLNRSAEFDDGMVTFEPDPGGTLVTIIARQKFALPLFWQVVNIDYLPEFKDKLVSDSYVAFFSRTMANFEAVYEGRSPLIGREWDDSYGEDDEETHPFEQEQVRNLLNLAAGLAQRWVQGPGPANGATEVGADQHGYRHFRPKAPGHPAGGDPGAFFRDLMSAVEKDLNWLRNNPNP